MTGIDEDTLAPPARSGGTDPRRRKRGAARVSEGCWQSGMPAS